MADIFIVGVRGIPNRYGGFERLVEVLAPHWARQGHNVTVFCEADTAQDAGIDQWQGVRRWHLKRRIDGPLGTILYDYSAFRHIPRGSHVIIFGYGTALFQHLLKRRHIKHAVNMDGIEWMRDKWGRVAKIWLKWNEAVAARLSDFLIADHPEIQRSLQSRFGIEAEMIAYGVIIEKQLHGISANSHPQEKYLSVPFFLIIARPEPENQIHIMLAAYRLSSSTIPLLVIGNFTSTAYGRTLIAAYPEVDFAGAIYDADFLNLLRASSVYYLHGHSVGGTNPSLIEAMAVGGLVVAHDNIFNRWVLGPRGLFFQSAEQLAEILKTTVSHAERTILLKCAYERCEIDFQWDRILSKYDDILNQLVTTKA
jgi:glycosyltransferase involved in cell wall biosynthesis